MALHAALVFRLLNGLSVRVNQRNTVILQDGSDRRFVGLDQLFDLVLPLLFALAYPHGYFKTEGNVLLGFQQHQSERHRLGLIDEIGGDGAPYYGHVNLTLR